MWNPFLSLTLNSVSLFSHQLSSGRLLLSDSSVKTSACLSVYALGIHFCVDCNCTHNLRPRWQEKSCPGTCRYKGLNQNWRVQLSLWSCSLLDLFWVLVASYPLYVLYGAIAKSFICLGKFEGRKFLNLSFCMAICFKINKILTLRIERESQNRSYSLKVLHELQFALFIENVFNLFLKQLVDPYVKHVMTFYHDLRCLGFMLKVYSVLSQVVWWCHDIKFYFGILIF